MTDFDPTRVPVGGTVRGLYSGMVYPADGPAIRFDPTVFVRDPGRHVDHTRTVDDGNPYRYQNRQAHRKPGGYVMNEDTCVVAQRYRDAWSGNADTNKAWAHDH